MRALGSRDVRQSRSNLILIFAVIVSFAIVLFVYRDSLQIFLLGWRQRQAVATSRRIKTTSEGPIVFPGAHSCAGPRTSKSRLV